MTRTDLDYSVMMILQLIRDKGFNAACAYTFLASARGSVLQQEVAELTKDNATHPYVAIELVVRRWDDRKVSEDEAKRFHVPQGVSHLIAFVQRASK